MPPLTIEGPGGSKFISLERAAGWLGLSESSLVRLLEDHPWLKVHKIRRSTRLDALDIAVLAHVLSRGAAKNSENISTRQEASGSIRKRQEDSGPK